jgi:hypothetical protein
MSEALETMIADALKSGRPFCKNCGAPEPCVCSRKPRVRKSPLTMENLRSRLSAKQIAALDARRDAGEIMHKINLVLSTCDPVPGTFEYFKRASEAFGSTDVPTLETVYLDLCTASGTTADGMKWAPHSEYKRKRGNFYAYCKLMERYMVWSAKGQARPTAKKSTPKKGKV